MKVTGTRKEFVELELTDSELIKVTKAALRRLIGIEGAEGERISEGWLVAYYRDYRGFDEHKVREATELDEHVLAVLNEVHKLEGKGRN